MGLYRFAAGEGAWTRFATPGKLLLVRGGADDFWLVGARVIHRWDGRALSRAKVPFDLGRVARENWQADDAWRSPSGTLWLVGRERGGKGAGAAARVAR